MSKSDLEKTPIYFEEPKESLSLILSSAQRAVKRLKDIAKKKKKKLDS